MKSKFNLAVNSMTNTSSLTNLSGHKDITDISVYDILDDYAMLLYYDLSAFDLSLNT